MDLVTQYREVINTVFAEWQRWPGEKAKFEVVPVVDREHDRYLLITQGWDGYRRIHGLLVHIDIVDGKLWIQQDNTEEGIATQLLEAGIPKESIVLAFKHPSVRPYTEFATA
jgi:hypothetical protein